MPSRLRHHGLVSILAGSVIGFFLTIVHVLQVPADPPADASIDLDLLRQKPITTAQGKVGELLRQWWKEGTAAGNAGDFYDNRDGDHSPLALAAYPQLSAIKYSPEDIKLYRHWAGQRVLLPHVTFGNSSTSAPPTQGGSNPRMYYTSPASMQFLANQYIRNNLYIYPEHRDHDPGHNGHNDGFGDLYPTNTPYLIISQGSSGSDQPFMRALPLVLAAFRPEVKKKLTEAGTLMPTIQMLLRSTNRHLKEPGEYLTGKAHPSVFEGAWVDELALVQQAHALELKALPPMTQLRVVEEDTPVNGVDYFDRVSSEVLANTPSCIARVHRRQALAYRVVLNADASFDLNKSPLSYTWVVLRGDAARIKIVPKKEDSSQVEITVPYHERRPVAPGSALESNRVDIGVFVHNGTYFSAPGFFTLHTLDHEARTYDADGKILEFAHGMGETVLRVTSWEKLLALAATDRQTAAFLHLDEKQKAGCAELARVHGSASAALETAQARVKTAEMALKAAPSAPDKEKAQKDLEKVRQDAARAQKALGDLLDHKMDALADTPRHFLEARLASLIEDPRFVPEHEAWLKECRTAMKEPRIKALWQRLASWSMAGPDESLTPLRPGRTLADAAWTRFERAQLALFHAELLTELAFPGVLQASYQVNFVDQRLTAPRSWRDLYHYDAKGACTGWTRYGDTGGKLEFNHEGLLVIEKDAQGRCLQGRTVRYVQEPFKGKGFNPQPLHAVPGDTLVRYEFDRGDDRRGRRAGTEPAPPKKQ